MIIKWDNSKYEKLVSENLDQWVTKLYELVKKEMEDDNNTVLLWLLTHKKVRALKRRLLLKQNWSIITNTPSMSTTQDKKFDWTFEWGKYSDLIMKYHDQKLWVLHQIIKTELINDGYNHLAINLTKWAVLWIRNRLRKKWLLSKKKSKLESYKLDSIKKNYKLSSQTNYLNRNLSNELKIQSTRESIIECLNKKVTIKTISPIMIKKKEVTPVEYTLQHTITDVHLNEVTKRIKKDISWDSERWLTVMTYIVNQLIEKKKTDPFNYTSLDLLFLGDLIGTKIHETIELDIEPNRASKIFASWISQSYVELKKHFWSVRLIFVPGNHAETRIWHEKTDTFNENYDFLVSQYTYEMLSVIGEQDSCIIPNRDIWIVTTSINNSIHGFGHGDRFNGEFKRMWGIFKRYYNISYLDYWHEWHFHNQKIIYDQWIMKMTYPCVTELSFYGQNRYWADFGIQKQVWNVYNDTWDLVYTHNIYVNTDKKIKKYYTPDINCNDDICEIFVKTLKAIKQ